MIASIVAIGDEIVSGLTIDTNSPFLADLLRSEGFDVVSTFAAPDDPLAIRTALERALSDADLVVTTGGLGPTADDLTTAIVAEAANAPLVLDEPSVAAIEARFRGRGLQMPENNRKQAMLPAGCDVLANPRGTAPGFICRTSRDAREKTIASLPGVPGEMARMARDELLPAIRALAGGRVHASRVFSIYGLSESALDELLIGVVAPGEARLAFRAAFPRLNVRVTVSGSSADDLERRLDPIEARVRQRLGDHLYAVGDTGLEEVVGRLLEDRGLTLAVAESCTGGLIGHRITDVAGSSAYFTGGVVAYSNSVKVDVLGVRDETLAAHGAVSTEVAEEMARGARALFGAGVGIATTGIAGPGGGTPDKPVGTVCIALSWETGVWSRRYDLGPRDRDWVKGVTAQVALNATRRWLLDRLED